MFLIMPTMSNQNQRASSLNHVENGQGRDASLLQQLLPMMVMKNSGDGQVPKPRMNTDMSKEGGGGGGGGGGGIVKLILVDMMARASPAIIGSIRSWLFSRAQARANKLARMVDSMGPGGLLVKRGSVVLERNLSEQASPESDMFDAVLQLASDRPDARYVRRHPKHGVFVINTNDEIMIGDGVFCRCMQVQQVDAGEEGVMKIEVYSNTKDVSLLRTFLHRIESDFRQQRDNHLGRSVCYFDEVQQTMDRTSLIFNMYPLETSKSLNNIYGGAVRTVRKRINFFLNNRSWYESRGLPYTLGIMLHGPPGTGKTSLIKALAHDTGRHILNVKLTSQMTASQLQGLFYSPTVKCVGGGKNTAYNIPTDNRIMVIEDADCTGGKSLLSRRRGFTDGKKSRYQKKPPLFDNSEISEVLDGLASKPISPTDLHQHLTIMTSLQNLKQLKDEYFRTKAVEQSQTSNKSSQPNQSIDLAMLLNVLDGVLECPGRIMVMTSNHPELLDPALLRPGRIDCIVNFGFCDVEDILEMVNAICDESVTAHDPRAANLPVGVWTPAEVTRTIFENIESLDTILERLSEGYVNKHACLDDSDSDSESKSEARARTSGCVNAATAGKEYAGTHLICPSTQHLGIESMDLKPPANNNVCINIPPTIPKPTMDPYAFPGKLYSPVDFKELGGKDLSVKHISYLGQSL